jgi:hypothetical protein
LSFRAESIPGIHDRTFSIASKPGEPPISNLGSRMVVTCYLGAHDLCRPRVAFANVSRQDFRSAKSAFAAGTARAEASYD